MTEAVTNILITAKDQTSQAFASVNSGLLGLSSQAVRATTALGAIGAGAALGSMVAFAKQTIDAQDELFKLSQKTGIAVESLAGLEFAAEQSGVELEKVASATRKFSLLVAESADKSSESAKKLAQLGISYKELKDLSPEKQLLALSDALSKFSKEDRAVALTSLLGNKMADLIPLLSGGSKGLSELIEQGRKLNPVTEESAKKAEQFNDQISLLNKSVSALGREMVQGIIPSLSRVTDEMVKVTAQSGFLSGAMAGVKQLFIESFGNPKILGDVGQIRREILKTEEAIAKLSLKKDSIFFDKNALEHEREKLVALKTELDGAIVKSRELFSGPPPEKQFEIFGGKDGNGESDKLKNKKRAQDELNKSQSEALRIESEYIKLLQHERKVREEFIAPYQREAKAAQDRLRTMRQDREALTLSINKQISLEQAIEQTTIARLEEKRAITKDAGAIDQINREIAARKEMVQIIQSDEARAAGDRVRQAELQAYEQFSIQAARNIQTNLAFGIEEGFRNGFKSGVKGLLNGIKNSVIDIVAQVLSLKLLQSTGIGGSLGLFGGGIGSIGGGSNALNIASIGTNALSLAKGGFGVNGLIGGGLTRLGGFVGSSSLSAFGGGLAGDAIGGLAAGGFSSGAASAASMGAMVGAAAGPLMAAFAATQLFKSFAGDKRMGGGFGKALNAVGDIPVLGEFIPVVPLMNTLFGRGPYKFRQQSLQGNISTDGFDGDITNVFKSKGGLFLGNKHKSITEALSQDMQDSFDLTIKGFVNSTKESAEVLGLSYSFIDTYNKEIQIKSEKGQQLTEEAIQGIFENLDNEFAQGVLPNIAEFRKLGEDSSDTLGRLTAEFKGLESSARNLGASAEYAKTLVDEMSISARTQLVDMLGGSDAAIQKTSFFFNNFLTDTQRLSAITEDFSSKMKDLGLSSEMTKEEFAGLIQAVGTSNELRTSLLNLQETFLLVANAAEQTNNALIAGAQNLGASSQLANELVSGMSEDAKNSFIELAGGTDAFLSSTQVFNENFLTDAENFQLASGKVNAELSRLGLTSDLTAQQLKDLVQDVNTTPAVRAGLIDEEFQRNFVLVKGSLKDTAEAAKDFAKELAEAKKKMREEKLNNALKVTDNALAAINQGVQKFLDLAKSVKDSINDIIPQSINDARASILGQINVNKRGQVQGVRDINSFDSNALSTLANQSSAGFSSRLDFERSRGKNLEILTLLNSAIDKSIAGEREAASVFNSERNQILRKLPSFDVGGIVPNTGLALVHKGERVINPQQNEAIVQLLQQLIVSMQSGSNYSKSLYDLFRRMTDDGRSLNTVAAA